MSDRMHEMAFYFLNGDFNPTIQLEVNFDENE
jgi:hypothetical protein